MEVLLSIKPEFANKIFEGTKRYEYRRVIFKNPRIKKIVVYASAPISKLIGEFEIEEVLSDQISIYGQEKDNATRALAVMNMWLHGKPSAEIVQGNTLAEWS